MVTVLTGISPACHQFPGRGGGTSLRGESWNLVLSLYLPAVTRVHTAPAAPSATALPASPVTRRSSEPQLCPGSAGESDKGPYSSPPNTRCEASPSPSLSSYSDPDSGHYCQLQPPVRGSREWAAAEASSRQARSYGERLIRNCQKTGPPKGTGVGPSQSPSWKPPLPSTRLPSSHY